MARQLLATTVLSAAVATGAGAEVPEVATDIPAVHSLVASVMGDLGTPDFVMQPGASPHSYSMQPSEAAALEAADIVFWIGAPLSPWLEGAIPNLAPDAVSVSLLAAPETETLDLRQGATFGAHDHGGHEAESASGGDGHGAQGHSAHGHEAAGSGGGESGDQAEAEHASHGGQDAAPGHEHAAHAGEDSETAAGGHEHAREGSGEAAGGEAGGHDHAAGMQDPHAWLDPMNARVWLDVIAAELSELDPENAGTYFANAQAAKSEMETLVEDVRETLAPVQDREFVAFHDSFQYFETRFGVSAAGAIALGSAADPGPARLQEVRDMIAEENVACVLAEPQFNPDLVSAVTEGADVATATVDPLAADIAPGPDLYPTLLRDIAGTLSECLSHDGAN